MKDPDVLSRAARFAAAASEMVEALSEAVEAFKSIGTYHVPDIQSSKWYEMAGRPYGNNTRGKKRWLREMKKFH